MGILGCVTGAFAEYPDVFMEDMSRAEKGPAVVAQLLNQYVFYQYLAHGYTVGEAFYGNNKTIFAYLNANNVLLGDPSLKIFNVPKTEYSPPDPLPLDPSLYPNPE